MSAAAALPSPGEAEAQAGRSIACLAAGNWAGARAALLAALAGGDATPATRLNLAIAEDRLGLDGRARMRDVAASCPGWDEPWLRLADSLRNAGARENAIAAYEQALARAPARAEALLGLATLLVEIGQAERAEVLLALCSAHHPDRADAWDARGLVRRLLGDPAGAADAFSEAQRLAPQDIGIALRRAEAMLAAGCAAAELARLEAALAVAPTDLAAMTARGLLLMRTGRAEAALVSLRTAVLLAPVAPEPAALLAEALVHAVQVTEAVPALRRAVELAPADMALRNNLAAALLRVHGYRESAGLLEGLIAGHGAQAPFLCNLATALVSLGRQREATETARRAIAQAPDTHLPWRTLLSVGIYDDAVDAEELRDVARHVATLAPRGPAPLAPRARDPRKRLRVGLLSHTLKTHPVGWLTVAAVEALDARAFEVVCFGQAPSADLIQRRFQARAAAWHGIAGRSPAETAAMIRAAEIDVLIDCGGWGDQGTLGVCAHRPAPVQIKWVGAQNQTTGLPEIDLFLADRWEAPAGGDSLYTERLLRLPDGYVVYAPPADAPAVGPLPAASGGGVTFGCFNNLAKITPRVIAAWSAILARVPASRLMLKTHQFSDEPTCDAIRAAFAAHGVDAGRLVLRGASPHRAHLAMHNEIDVMLDPFPYAGGLTTCEALWMGVPVLTLAGRSFAARHSASHLSNAGLGDWVAEDIASYTEMAVARAADPAALARLRAELRPRLKASPLTDGPRFGAHLGAALRGAWAEACAA